MYVDLAYFIERCRCQLRCSCIQGKWIEWAMCEESLHSCSLGARILPTRKSEAIWRFPWTYSFLRRTLKVANCCDLPEQCIGYLFSGTYLLFLYLFPCCCVVGLWQKHPDPVPARQTKWASSEASTVAHLPREKCLRVFVAERWWVAVIHQTC
jgi:hypothetical protein